MTCTESRRLMHLNRPDERSEHETQALLDHVAGCGMCAREARDIEALQGLEERLREARTPVPNLFDVRSNVLRSIAHREASHAGWSWIPRLAYVTAVAGVCGWFMFGQWSIRRSNMDLNQRILPAPSSSVGPQIVYRVDAAAVRTLAESTSSLTGSFAPDGGDIEIPQSSVIRLAERSSSTAASLIVRRPADRAAIGDLLQFLRSGIDVTVRYRSKGV